MNKAEPTWHTSASTLSLENILTIYSAESNIALISVSWDADASKRKNKSTGVVPGVNVPPSFSAENSNAGLNPMLDWVEYSERDWFLAMPSLTAETTFLAN